MDIRHEHTLLKIFSIKKKTNCLVNKIIDIELFIWLYYKKKWTTHRYLKKKYWNKYEESIVKTIL